MDKVVDKKEYLKKYLGGSDKKKRKKKNKSSEPKSKIIDDDLDLKNMKPIDENELDIYDLAEDAPQVAGIIDDRPEEIRVMSEYRETKKWKIVTREYEDVQVSAVRGDDSDKSPDRENAKNNSNRGHNNSDSDISVNRGIKSDSDASPPRKKISSHRSRGDVDSDHSPTRKSKLNEKRHSKDQSNLKQHRKDSDSDFSPERLKRNDSGREKRHPSRSESHKHREHHRPDEHRRSDKSEKMTKTLDGKKAGLQNAADMKKEAHEIRKKQEESLSKLGDDVSGRGAATIMRDRKTGKRRDMKEEAKQKKEKEAKNAEIIEKYAVWGKGMKQIDDRAIKMKEDMHEMAKPVARYADDEDLEVMRRNEEREGDPMLEYMRSKRKKEGGGPVKPQYQGSYNPNRHNIKPGHQWDGVDRSNGYEKKWFEERNARKAREEEAFKWSTEDM